MGIIHPPRLSPEAMRYRRSLNRIFNARAKAVSAGNYKLATFWDEVSERLAINYWSR